jgi:hypothetical protein
MYYECLGHRRSRKKRRQAQAKLSRKPAKRCVIPVSQAAFCVPGLNNALGGHVLAKVLAKLRVRRRIRPEMATDGRPGECWFPCDLPQMTHVSIVGAMPTSE